MSKDSSARRYKKNLVKKTRQYGRKRYKNLSENEKQKLVDCRKRNYEKLKNEN